MQAFQKRIYQTWLVCGLLLTAAAPDRSPALAAGDSQSTTPARVERWGRFEAALTNPKRYDDPFRDVRLEVTYTRPDGRAIPFWGFYDGGRTWKLRFMPDVTGTWRYEARFSDRAGVISNAISSAISGRFECIPSDLPGMLSRDRANPAWFGFAGGRHVLVRSLHVGDRFFAQNWPQPNRAEFLDWAGSQGYNMLSVASHYLNREVQGRGSGWKTPDLWDAAAGRPKPAEYAKAEAILDQLAHRRMMVYPFAGFFGQSSDFPTDPGDQELYVRYTLARIGPYWNVLLNVAGPEPIGRNQKFQNAMARADVHRLGAMIARLDVFGHPLSVHNPGGDDPFGSAAWSSFVTLQGWKDRDLAKTYAGMLKNRAAGKPVYAQEVFWSGNKFHGDLSDVDLRKKAYVLLMAGTAINFGDMDGDSSSGFSGSLDLKDRNQPRHDVLRRVWDFFQTVPFHRMKPQPGLVNQGYCLAEPGREYLVYLDAGGPVDVRIEDGPYLVQWINAQNTLDQRFGGQTDDGRTVDGRSLTAPTGKDDWLLRLRKPTARFAVNDDNSGTTLDGRPFVVQGLRVSNALISDATTQQLIDRMDELGTFGINTFSVFFQGSRFGDVRGYRQDATLDPVYARRMGRIIEAAAHRGMAVLVGCLYYGNSLGKWDDWTEADAARAVANTVRWLKRNGYRNTFVDVNNEHMAKFDDARLIAAGQAVDPSHVIATSGRVTPDNAALSMHHGRPDLPGKYYIETEGTMPGGYWGAYSKREGYPNYINIGVYPDDMKQKMLRYTDDCLDRGHGYIFASTWLQCVPPHGPNHTPGGNGTRNAPGIRWWLEHLKTRSGR